MSISFGSRVVSDFGVPYIIAEIGANHNGDMELARKLVVAAKESGCDCVKFQSWSKKTIFSAVNYRENKFLSDDYRQRKDFTLEKIVEAFSLDEGQLRELKEFCDNAGIHFSSSVFSRAEADFLVEELKAPFVKIASMDITTPPLLEYVAGIGTPVVLSTGLSDPGEVDRAVLVMEAAGVKELALLHCVSNYPPREECVNLRNMEWLRTAYPGCPVGYSDHTMGAAAAVGAVALGASIIEKHFTLDKGMFGWDHAISTDPAEMAELVRMCRSVRACLGSTRRTLTSEDAERRPAFRRSIVAARDIKAGTRLAVADLDFKRPGIGISPVDLDHVVGRVVKKHISADEIIVWQDFDGEA